MSTTATVIGDDLERLFPLLAEEGSRDVRKIMENAKTLSFPANQQVSSPGSSCELYILVLTGSIRVQILTDSGREVVLYHVRPGDGCILTTTCLLSGDAFPAEGITDSTTTALALSRAEFDLALQQSPHFRHLVFANLGQRLADVITRIEQLCSPSIERHLAAMLIESQTDNKGSITTTHQKLAGELGTAREVVSRHLKRFEEKGWVRLGRGTIQIREPETLTRLSE